LDLGGKWDFAPDWSVAGVFKNLGGSPGGYPLPRTLSLAGSWRPFPEWLLLDLELGFPLYDGYSDFGLGAEFEPWEWLYLRLGLKTPLTGQEAAAQNGVVFGAGFLFSGFSLDLALMGKGDLGSEVSLSLGYQFGGQDQAASTAAVAKPQAEAPIQRIATPSDQEQAEYHFRAGQEYEKYNQVIDAIVEYKAALKLRPNYPEALTALAAAKDKARTQAEEDQAESEAAKTAGQPESMQKLISKYYREGEAAYQKKDYTVAIQKLQLVLEMTTQHRQATELLEKARAALNSEMGALRRQAQQAQASGDVAAELEAYQKMLDLRPDDKRAKEDLEALKARIPQEAERLYKTGVEFYAKREYRKALSTFERVIKLQPDNVKARDALNNTKEKLIQTGQ
jgi:tetratricopeptide (TPR) repeat protein